MTYRYPSDGIPRALADIALFASPGSNSVISKRYLAGEGSQAFGWHADPRKFESVLAPEWHTKYDLFSFGGYAILGVLLPSIKEELFIACRANTQVRVYGNLKHAITPPLSRETFDHFCETGELDMTLGGEPESRTFGFVGRDITLATDEDLRWMIDLLAKRGQLSRLMSVLGVETEGAPLGPLDVL
jgi:hypothetical protein